MRPLTLLLLVVGLLAGASARADDWNSQRPAVMTQTGARVVTGSPGSQVTTAIAVRDYPNTGNGLNVLRDMVKGPSPKSGEVIDVAVKRVLTPKNIGRAIGRAMPVVSTALAVKDLLDDLRCQEAFGGGIECDLGGPTEERETSCRYIGLVTGLGGKPTWQGGTICGFGQADLTLKVSEVYVGAGREIVWRSETQFGYKQPGAGSVYVVTPTATSTGVAVYCPPIKLPDGTEIVPVPGPDGKCPTGSYQPATPDHLGDLVEQYGQPSKVTPTVPELVGKGVPIDHDPPTVDVPSVIVGDRETTTNPDGSTTVTDNGWQLSPSPTGPGYTWTPSRTTVTYPPGATIPPPGQLPTSGGTTTTGGNTSPTEVITCGLPGKPPCKIDETGTPTQGDLSQAQAKLTEIQAQIEGVMTPVELPWVWGWSMPTGACSPIEVPSFVNGVPGGQIDLCSHPAMQFWRRLWAWLLTVLAGWYAWRRYSSQVGAR